jgi:hypothetical protein
VGVELVKVVRRDGEEFDCATWLHKAKEMPKDGLKYAVEQHLTGRRTAEREKEFAAHACGKFPRPIDPKK